MIRVTEVGWKARRLIGGVSGATVVAALRRSLYLEVAGEIVWLGGPGSPLHGRAIVAGAVPAAEARERIDLVFDLSAAREWRPATLTPPASAEILGEAARRLAGAVERLGAPGGFGALLVGRRPSFPLAGAAELARSFLEACAADHAPAAAAIAERLLGLGPGLTPAGDDVVGGALFARRALCAADSPSWRAAAETLRARAAERTHRISATLLGDLLDGEGLAPLHQVALALARSDAAAALGAAARLVRIGHSSGWDLLTGLLGGLGAVPAR